MAKRKTSHIKIETEEVQGEGSYAIVRRMNVREMRKFRQSLKKAGEEYDAFEAGTILLKQNVVEWDWVGDDLDENGDPVPLPQPKDDPEVIELLTDAEVAVLGKAIRGADDEDLKN